MARFDTHALFTTLHTQGFSAEQAEGLTTALATVTDAIVTLDSSQNATKADVRELRVLLEGRLQTVDAKFTFTHWMIGLTFTVLLGFSLGNLWLLVNLLGRLPRP